LPRVLAPPVTPNRCGILPRVWTKTRRTFLKRSISSDHMVTKAEFNEAVEKLDNRLTGVESKIGGIHNRIDDEALKRGNLKSRVRSVVPNLPPPPERV
jgi:hypothetical protein